MIWIQVRAFRFASLRLGLNSTTALILLLASLAGTFDGILSTGILAVLLASTFSPIDSPEPRVTWGSERHPP